MIDTVYRSDEDWSSTEEEVIAHGFLCTSKAGSVDYTYVKNAVSKADIIMKYYNLVPSRRRMRRELVGFLLLQQKKGERWYIDVVCSQDGSGAGKKLVQHVINTGRQAGRSFIDLRALPHVESYYKRFGFRYPAEVRRGSTIDGSRMQKNLAMQRPPSAKENWSSANNWEASWKRHEAETFRRSPRLGKRSFNIFINTPPLPSERRTRRQ
jgi:predicted GNAT family N-acyltransferase